jgi:hypothetical protein
VVIAEGWRLWLEILPAISSQDVKVWCQARSLLSTYFKDLHGNCMFDELQFDELHDLSQISKVRRPMIFVAGSRFFVQRIKKQFRHLKL